MLTSYDFQFYFTLLYTFLHFLHFCVNFLNYLSYWIGINYLLETKSFENNQKNMFILQTFNLYLLRGRFHVWKKTLHLSLGNSLLDLGDPIAWIFSENFNSNFNPYLYIASKSRTSSNFKYRLENGNMIQGTSMRVFAMKILIQILINTLLSQLHWW